MWKCLSSVPAILFAFVVVQAQAAGLRSMEYLFQQPQNFGADLRRMLNEPRSTAWAAKVAEFRRLPASDRPDAVQRYVNGARAVPSHPFRPVPPSVMMSRGGDCKGYALAKMAMLQDLGVPEADMRLTVVALPFHDEAHAVLLVRQGGRHLVLDNLADEVTIDRYSLGDFTAVLGLFRWPAAAASTR